MRTRSHHETLSTIPTLLTALSVLVPFAGALWARIVSMPSKNPSQKTGDL